MKKQNPKWNLKDRLLSFRYAFSGLKILLKTQHNARIHLIITIVVVGVGFFLRVGEIDWCLLTLAMCSVWITETLNTAIEFLTDLVSPEYHPTAGKVKDLAAAAVFIAATGAMLVGLVVFIPKFAMLLH